MRNLIRGFFDGAMITLIFYILGGPYKARLEALEDKVDYLETVTEGLQHQQRYQTTRIDQLDAIVSGTRSSIRNLHKRIDVECGRQK